MCQEEQKLWEMGYESIKSVPLMDFLHEVGVRIDEPRIASFRKLGYYYRYGIGGDRLKISGTDVSGQVYEWIDNRVIGKQS